jgi:hypothetical protein
MHRSRVTRVLLLVMALSLSVATTSCGTEGQGSDDLVLVGFNLPNLSGITLNNPLIFTFSANIAPSTITPDTLRVVGVEGPFFETTVVDGNLVALLPRSPNFEDYSDAGLLPNVSYTVSMTTFPDVTTIESATGKPLLEAESFTFVTQPFPVFIEPRRPIVHGVPWTMGGRSDDAGCLQNRDNDLYLSPTVDPATIQTGSTTGATLLCLQNEGPPRVIEANCTPRHDQQAVGTPSPVAPGLIQLDAVRVRLNENLDPLTVVPYIPTTQIPVNIQLWRVGQKDNSPIATPEAIQSNKPVVVQDLDQTEIILVPSGAVQQGVYLVNITPALKDLPGNGLRIDDRPDPVPGGYDIYEGAANFQSAVPPGYRIYFKTLEIPNTPFSIIEDFANNLAEWGNNDSTNTEPGINTQSDDDPGDATLDGSPLVETIASPTPSFTTTFDGLGDPLGIFAGQTTTAAWNASGGAAVNDPISDVDGYRFLNIPTLSPNPHLLNPKPGTLQAVYQPWCGSGIDNDFISSGVHGLNTNIGSINGDGIYEYTSFNLQAGHSINVAGGKPLVILCQGNVNIDGTIRLDGGDGSPGFDDDGSSEYDPANGAIPVGGAGGFGVAGGGHGGIGADGRRPGPSPSGAPGVPGVTLFGDGPGAGSAGGGPGFVAESAGGANDGSCGGGGGAFGGNGGPGTFQSGAAFGATASTAFGDMDFLRALALFQPDRGYQSNANITGGCGGAGGSIEDDDGASEVGNGGNTNRGDDGGGGGGAAGGGLWIIARGNITIGGSAVVTADGGNGGNTYARADQFIADDEGTLFLAGVLGTPVTGSGEGGPGGGGSGGGLFFVARGDLTTAAGATLSAKGGVGGTSGNGATAGGNGGSGRVTLMTFDGGGTVSHAAGASTEPAAEVRDNVFFPVVDLCSVGQSDWVDLFTASTEYETPTFTANFDGAGGGFLEIAPPSGAGKVFGVDFAARWEFQAADMLNPQPALGMPPPSTADGLTEWTDVGDITMLNFKRFMRWRWRFFHKDGWGQDPGDPDPLQLATVFVQEIPFTK